MADNLTYNDILDDIDNGQIKKLYLFYGPEPLLIRDVIVHMEKQVINPAFANLNYSKFDGSGITVDTIINACETLPFMDSRKLVLVKDCDFFKGKKSQGDGTANDTKLDELCGYLSNLPETVVLVLTAGSEIDKRKKLYNSIKTNGDIVEFTSFKGQELINWIVKTVRGQGKLINKADALYLTERISGSLDDMFTEICKICSFAGDSPSISRESIDAVVSKSLENNIFELVDYITSKQPGRALSVLNDLLLDSQPVPVILTMIIRQYRLLLNAMLLSEKGYPVSQISSKLGVRPFVLNNLQKMTRYYTINDIEEKLRHCLNTDISIKLGRIDQRTAVETMITKLSI